MNPPKAYNTYFITHIITSSDAATKSFQASSTNSSTESVTSVKIAPTVNANIHANAKAVGSLGSDKNGDPVDRSHTEFKYSYPANTSVVLTCFKKSLIYFSLAHCDFN